MLAVMCHYGFAPVPSFSDRYRRRTDESAAENLCGLWSVGPSTFYRYLDKGKRLLALQLFDRGASGTDRLSLRRFVHAYAAASGLVGEGMARVSWHEARAESALAARDGAGALWHLLHAGNVDGFVGVVNRFRMELAHDDEAAGLIEQCLHGLPARQHVELLLARAALWRTRNDPERELQTYEQSLQIADRSADRVLLGIVQGAMGRFHESRDTDRAFAYFEDSAESLRRASSEGGLQPRPEVLAEYLSALIKVAWLCVLRNDPRSREVLDKAELLRTTPGLPEQTVAMLEQTWGEYWRRAGEPRRALGHKHRALNIYERLGDRQQVISTFSNLSILYTEAKDFTRAVEYGQRVAAMAGKMPVDPYLLASTHVNLGSALFWMEQYGAAIEHYQRGLDLSLQAGLSVIANRAHYNLAEAYYKRFQACGDLQDEARGDSHVVAVVKASASETDTFLREATLQLKAEVLGTDEGFTLERLQPAEHAAYPDEMAEIQRQRRAIAVPADPQVHARARLAIARSYLAISTKEREAAQALIDKHDLGKTFAGDLADLHAEFNRELTREQRLAAQWAETAADLLADDRRVAVLDHLFRASSIQKSIYAKLCGVSSATASKHLVALAQRGLLAQVGKGPATRYLLPD